jgi:hypothetical protein
LEFSRSIFFGQLGSFALHMLSLGVDPEDTQAFISKQCVVNGLTEDQCEMLLVKKKNQKKK